MASPRGGLAVLLAVVVGVGWLGCGTDNGNAGEGEPEPVPSSTSTSKTDGGSRPPFEAGFEDAGEPNPEPDGGGDTCIDKNDQGGTESAAKALPDTDDGQNDPISQTGVLDGPVDVDFFKIRMADKTGRLVEANFELETSGVEMCVFVKCQAGATTVDGCNGGVLKTSDIGTKGCCATGPSQATPNWDCPGFTDNDSADFFVRFKQTQDKCTTYSWTYRF